MSYCKLPYKLLNYKLQSLRISLRIKPKLASATKMALHFLGPVHPLTSLLLLPTCSWLASLGPSHRSFQGCSSPHSGLSSDLTCSGRLAMTSHADPSLSIPLCFPLFRALTLLLHYWLLSVYLPLLEGKVQKGKDLVLLIHQDILGAWNMTVTWEMHKKQ